MHTERGARALDRPVRRRREGRAGPRCAGQRLSPHEGWGLDLQEMHRFGARDATYPTATDGRQVQRVVMEHRGTVTADLRVEVLLR